MIRSNNPETIRSYLSDASNIGGGYAEEVVFPVNEQEVAQTLDESSLSGAPVTVSGNGTGTVGARVPFGGIVLSTEKLGGLKTIVQSQGDNWHAVAGPAITLKKLQDELSQKGLLYPPDPTEPRAFLGASVATNASGARNFKYGATRQWVRRLRVVLATGDILELRRGECVAGNDGALFLKGKRNSYKIKLPTYTMPKGKHSAGYYATPGMSALDLFIGSEGTLGVITEIEIGLIVKPLEYYSGIVFFHREADAWQFAEQAKVLSLKNRAEGKKDELDACALEYFDSHALMLLRSPYPHIPGRAQSAIFFEQDISPEARKKIEEEWLWLCRENHVLINESWFGKSSEEHKEYRVFRHAIPALVNGVVRRQKQRKIGTDFAVPGKRFLDLMNLYRSSMEGSGLRYCVFGHIADNHLHLNILPENNWEAERGWQLCHKLVTQVVAWGGTVAAEHGVGKLKKEYLLDLYGESGLNEMAMIKKKLDPAGILGRGSIFPDAFLQT
ncbi:MAG: FAD-binding oxidoreductase [Candidatus Brocadiaceae bacterium]|nr:FAD-binding oxidoreductase [Candidatus Brocadiaceae bacterium]